MFGQNRTKHLQKIQELFSQMPDKASAPAAAGEDKSGEAGEAGKVDLGLSNKPMGGHQLGALPNKQRR